jgi:NitT/TauT family transport system substrate-binding protein
MAPSWATPSKRRWAVVAALATLLAACSAPPPPPTPLRFGMDLWPGYFPAVIAEREGGMARRGVALSIEPVRDTSALLADFAAGRYDVVGVSMGDAITLGLSRPDLVVLLVADESTGGDMLLRAPGADEARAGDGPLRIGTNLGGFGELFAQEWVARNRLSPSRVAWTDIDASDVPAALADGRIDYGHTWQPYAQQAIDLGATPVFTSAETPGLIIDVVLTTRATVARKPDALRAFAEAWFEAAERWRADPASGDAVATAALGLPASAASLDGIALYGLADNQRIMAGGAQAPLAAVIRRYADFFVEGGSVSAPPPAEAMFDPRLLPTP